MMRIDFDAMRRGLGKTWVRRVGLAAGVVVAGGVGLLAFPSRSGNVPMPNRAACCTGAVSVGDTQMVPSSGQDKDFFEVPSTPPSAIFLVGNNESMQDFPEPLPEVGDTTVEGCSDPALVSAMSWFDMASADVTKNGSVVYDKDTDFGTEPQFFNPNIWYQSRGQRIAWVVEDFPFSLSWDFRTMDGNTDTWSACNRALRWGEAWGSPRIATCEACLKSKGWWRGPLESNPPDRADIPPRSPAIRRVWVVSGRVLNVRPPKFVVARKVLKDVIDGTNNIRMGVAAFGPDRGWYDPPQMLAKLRPTCDQSFPTINETALNQPLLKQAVNRVEFRNNERSIGEALFGLGGYFSSQLVDGRWLSWFQQPINPPWGWPGGWTGGTYNNPHTGQDGAPWAYQNDEWVKGDQPWEGTGTDRSVCFSCQVNSVIVLTDGAPVYDNSVPITKMMQILIAKGAKHPDGTPLTFDSANPETNTNPGGVNYCDQFDKAPGVKATKEDCDYTDYNWPAGLAKTNKNFMDDVAFFMANADLRGDMSGNQTMRTYTIGYGDNSAMLQSIAMAGKGAFYRANNATELRESIQAALGDLKQVSTSFSSANITGVQAGGVQSSVYIPRFVPRKSRPYEGHLYRYFYFNEFAQGCEAAKAKSTAGDKFDLNGDKDCNDSFFLDKPASFAVTPGAVPTVDMFTSANIVQENTEGNWVKVKTATRNSDGMLEGGDPAVPFWNVGDTIGARKAMAPCNRDNPLDPTSGRCIFTMIDRDKDGKFTDADNPPVEFTTDNFTDLKELVLAAGDNFCGPFFSRQKKVWTGTAAQQDECVKDLIRFIRGVDVLDFDGDSIFDEERPCADNKKPTDTKSCKLADIFHSTPVTVEPPSDPFLCSMGLGTQCLPVIYQDFSPTVTSMPLCSAGGAPCYKPTPMLPERTATTYGAYDTFKNTYATRERIALVGSNGGMLHAIHVGSSISKTKTSFLDDTYDLGTGQEMWAFIPPDLLPKLGQIIYAHQYYVDGTPMVRDIWADGAVTGTRNGIKEPEEFRTLAVITERGGGQRYVGLDVTNPREMLKADGKPFRWMFPNACDPESATVGESWSNYTPKPPPIGPVRLKPLVATPSSTARGWEERWIVMLNGGFSPDLSRGRGLYMVDVWSGKKLWSAEAHPGPVAGDTYKALMNQMMPFVSSASLVDLGKAENVQRDLDGFFDTLIIGDLGGQAWTFRFFEPGERDSSTEIVKNWYGARSLEMSRDDSSVGGPNNLYMKAPFTNIATSIIQPETGWLRSFMGTGDRSHLRTTPGTDCGPDDLLACIRLKCDVKAVFASDINGRERTSTIEYVAGVLKTNSENVTGSVDASVCKSSKMELTSLNISCPDGTTLGTGTYTSSTNTQSNCTPSGGMWTCTQSPLAVGLHSSITLNSADKTAVPSNRYFGFHSYGGPLRNFKDDAGAVKFDKMRVTDTAGFDCGTDSKGVPINCSLVDVTIPDSAYASYTTTDGKTVKYVPVAKLSTLARGSAGGPGWFMRYSDLQERTAAGSAVISGVVAWPSFAPAAGGGVTACSLVGTGDVSNTWQADVITGLPNQAEGFRLYNDKGELLGFRPNLNNPTSAPPGDIGTVVLVSPKGEKKYGFSIPPPPKGSPDPVTAESDTNKTPEVYWLEVPRNLHKCRHENSADCK